MGSHDAETPAGRWGHRGSGAWRMLVPFVGLFLLLVLFAGGGMLVIAREADLSDAARARDGVARTFAAQLAYLDAAVQMNAKTTPVADFLTTPHAQPSSAHMYFNFTNKVALGFYGTIVLNRDGTAFAGTYAGRPWRSPALDEAARFVAPLAARLSDVTPATVHGILRDSAGRAVAVSVTNVVSDDGEAAASPRISARRLAMLSPVADQLVPRIMPALGVESFHIGSSASGSDELTIPVEDGAPLVFAWQPRSPGRTAIIRWAPTIGLMFAAALVMLAVAMRSSLATTRKLEWLAGHDSLTGLPNRSAFRAELDRRLSDSPGIAVGMGDLDGFKAVNDAHGHPVGDDLLRAVAAEYLAAASEGDFVARLGGDEFAWISPSRTAADRLAAAMTTRLARPLAAGDRHLRVGSRDGHRGGKRRRQRTAVDEARRRSAVPEQGALGASGGEAGYDLIAGLTPRRASPASVRAT